MSRWEIKFSYELERSEKRRTRFEGAESPAPAHRLVSKSLNMDSNLNC